MDGGRISVEKVPPSLNLPNSALNLTDSLGQSWTALQTVPEVAEAILKGFFWKAANSDFNSLSVTKWVPWRPLGAPQGTTIGPKY